MRIVRPVGLFGCIAYGVLGVVESEIISIIIRLSARFVDEDAWLCDSQRRA